MKKKRTRVRGILLMLLGLYAFACLASAIAVTIKGEELAPLPAGIEAIETAAYTREGFEEGHDPVRFAYRDRRAEFADSEYLPILLLHGSPGDLSNFGIFETLVDDSRRVISVDLPGFGHSSKDVPDYSNRAHARYVLDLLDHLGIERVHAFGFSMGGGVCIEMDRLAPERLASITMFGAIGIQEGEGSGDYYFEQMKYMLGHAALAVVPELIPHFGRLPGRSERLAFTRNFLDNDQRPYRAALEEMETPLLVLHGRGDFLVHPWVAEAHHDIVEHSELVMLETTHFALFEAESATMLAEHFIEFVDRVDRAGFVAERRAFDLSEERARGATDLPIDNITRDISPWLQMWIIAAATLVSEDGTAVGTGVLVAEGTIDGFVGIVGCWVGIFLGDMGLYLIGRIVGRRALDYKPVRAWLPTRSIDSLGEWFNRRAGTAIMVSRCIPGSRLPLYLAAGVARAGAGNFAFWTAIAALIWTPLVVLLAAASWIAFGELADWLKLGPVAVILAIIFVVVVTRVAMESVTHRGRQMLAARWCKIMNHEFWPGWIFYIPVVGWIAILALRHRSLMVWTLANPGMRDGGVIGESKHAIVQSLPERWVLQAVKVEASDDEAKRVVLAKELADQVGGYPLIAKPDAAQRGVGVKKITAAGEFEAYFEDVDVDVQLQEYHPGPSEAGVFYVRMPGEERGRIFSITHKEFQFIEGDGERTIEELIWSNRRTRVQQSVFHERFADRLTEVLPDGEKLRLSEAGNHAQGCMFRDGAHLMSKELEDRVDEIAREVAGFNFGRFDMRYENEELFRRG
ncbi:MAG: alpha/beta fold hydrolase, partial [Planctomycetota bacterium]